VLLALVRGGGEGRRQHILTILGLVKLFFHGRVFQRLHFYLAVNKPTETRIDVI
jgi:hypothetical protein